MSNLQKINQLRQKLSVIYEENSHKLLFHWRHHIDFVTKKSILFWSSISANLFLVESAALVHDLNYIVEVNSEPEVAEIYRSQLLSKCWYHEEEIQRIENIINESHTSTRWEIISQEWKALSDADTLFKALPITPILFANNYIKQNNVDIAKLAHKIIGAQKPLLEEWIYFYTEMASSKYLRRAETNLQLRENIEECLGENDVQEMLDIAYDLKVI